MPGRSVITASIRCCDLDKITPVDPLQQGTVMERLRKTVKGEPARPLSADGFGHDLALPISKRPHFDREAVVDDAPCDWREMPEEARSEYAGIAGNFDRDRADRLGWRGAAAQRALALDHPALRPLRHLLGMRTQRVEWRRQHPVDRNLRFVPGRGEGA